VGVINLNIQPTDQPIEIDEAYVRAYFGKVDVEGGLRKLTWGKADSMGPLDVINPIDYSDLTDLSDMMNLKIARPLVHISLFLGQFSKLEGVFVPWFEPKRFSENGRWWPQQLTDLDKKLSIYSKTLSDFQPDTSTLDYAQAGLRFTTTIGGAADIGVQYYYGRLTTPAVTTIPAIPIAYNPYHQIGLDYAQVVAGFNVRAELAANITGDLKGDDAAVYNPSIAWSFGFDRDFFGINLNLQANEAIRLFDGNITSSLDIEANSDITSTQIIAQIAKKFMQDKLELNARVRWEVEAGSCIIMPGISWTNNDVTAELSTGIFTGMDDSFVKIGVKYAF
jgi:hypothetical protein